jgi:hypothetical protein
MRQAKGHSRATRRETAGRPATLMRRDAQNQPQSAEQLVKSLSADAWRGVAWREGIDKTLRSRFAGVRVRPAHRDYWRSPPYPKNGFSLEWPQDALADRVRLSGTQVGTRARSLPRTRLARLSPPHGALHRKPTPSLSVDGALRPGHGAPCCRRFIARTVTNRARERTSSHEVMSVMTRPRNRGARYRVGAIVAAYRAPL